LSTKLLTTGQAAKLCSVTPDTVLKWIHSGALAARRTAGGHHRIDEQELTPFLEPTQRPDVSAIELEPTNGSSEESVTRYCWEYNNEEDTPEGCRDCVVYQLRAQRCYEVAKLSPELGHTKLHCKGNCMDCEYYRRVHLQATNVMVVTDDSDLIATLEQQTSEAPYNMEITNCEYSCSALVDTFRPDYVVVDCSFGPERSSDIANHLIEDPRLPHVRVVMAADEASFPEGCNKNVFARIERPFRVTDITGCIYRAQTN